MTPEQVAEGVSKVVADNQEVLQERRYTFNSNILVGKVGVSACLRGGPPRGKTADASAPVTNGPLFG